MFQCVISEKFSLAHTKMTYSVCHGPSKVIPNGLIEGTNATDSTIDVRKVNQMDERMEVGAKAGRLLKQLIPFEQKDERELMLKFYVKEVTYIFAAKPSV